MFIEVLPGHVPGHLEALSQSDVLTSFYMGGGTGLALQMGHRRSVVLGFFTQTPFDPSDLATKIAAAGHFTVESKSSGTLRGIFHNIKLSFFLYQYPLLKDFHYFLGISIADPIDIGCMKIDAISSRGSRKDFIDLYVICNEIVPLSEMLRFFGMKYKGIEYNKVHILKSLVYFDEAEQEPALQMLKRIEWDDVKKFFVNESKAVSQQWQ